MMPAPPAEALAGFTTKQLLAEVAVRMKSSQNSIAGVALGDQCEEATRRLSGGVLDYRRDLDGAIVLDADDHAVYTAGYRLGDAADRFLRRLDVTRVLTLLDMQPGGCDVLNDLRDAAADMHDRRIARRAAAWNPT